MESGAGETDVVLDEARGTGGSLRVGEGFDFYVPVPADLVTVRELVR